jgi:hypothetical protein
VGRRALKTIAAVLRAWIPRANAVIQRAKAVILRAKAVILRAVAGSTRPAVPPQEDGRRC